MLDPIVKELNNALDGFETYLAFHDDSHSFILDSGMDHKKLGQYSFIGSDPFLIFKAKANSCEMIKGTEVEYFNGNPFDILQEICSDYKINNPSQIPLPGGAVGYFSYDMGNQLEKLPDTAEDDLLIPDCYLCFYDSVVVIDHLERKTYLISTGFPYNNDEEKRLTYAQTRLKELERKISTPIKKSTNHENSKKGKISSNFKKEEYLEAVGKVKEYIAAGDIYQANLTQRLETELTMPPIALYEKLRSINPAPFAFFLNYPEVIVASSSPERFIKLKDNQVETRPIKGTRPRGNTAKEDQILRNELVNSEKDKAELLMIVDLERNDLGRVCEVGSVKVPELFSLETYATVYHLVSTVVGDLPPGKDIFDVLKGGFPGGSITGAPKIRAMEIIDELEPTKRNIYTGSVGYVGFDGDADLNIVIRTFIIKNNKAYFQVGGGIVADSNPEDEYQETLHKAKALINALGLKI